MSLSSVHFLCFYVILCVFYVFFMCFLCVFMCSLWTFYVQLHCNLPLYICIILQNKLYVLCMNIFLEANIDHYYYHYYYNSLICLRINYSLLAWGANCHIIELLRKEEVRDINFYFPVSQSEPKTWIS